jgi:hypothetical protein
LRDAAGSINIAGPVRRSTLREMHEGQRWISNRKYPAARWTSPELREPLDLALSLDDVSGRIVAFSARAPAPPDATCWQ